MKELKLDPNEPMMPISIVANALKVHQRSLRLYDYYGILVPKRSPKNRRLYSTNDLQRGMFIQYMTRELSINIAGVKIIFELLDRLNITPDQYMNFLSEAAKELGITLETQQENKEKMSRRGRKPVKKDI